MTAKGENHRIFTNGKSTSITKWGYEGCWIVSLDEITIGEFQTKEEAENILTSIFCPIVKAPHAKSKD